MRSLIAVAALVGTVALGSPAQAASVPTLPSGSDSSCVAPSTQTVTELPWAQKWLAPARAWDLTRGRGTTVAVVDSGVGSPASLAGAVESGTTDCRGHGTFLASLVAGRPRDGIGFSGIAPAATVLAVPITTTADVASPVRLAAPDGLAHGIIDAVEQNADVVLIGANANTGSDALRYAVRVASAANVLVVAGVGTVDRNGRPLGAYPAAYPEVLGVGAIEANGVAAPFSAAGGDVDLAAPGVGIVGAGPSGDGHYAADGTAMAAAFVAGTAALVRAYRPDLDADGVVARLRFTAVPPPTLPRDAALGFGTVNPAGAVGDEIPADVGVTAAPPSVAAVAVPARPKPDHAAEFAAVAITGGSTVLLVVGWTIHMVLSRSRTRRSS